MAKSAAKDYEGVWDGRLGFGNKSALVVIDLLKGYTTEGSDLYAPGVVDCVKEMPELLKAARTAGIDIFHTQVRYNPTTFTASNDSRCINPSKHHRMLPPRGDIC